MNFYINNPEGETVTTLSGDSTGSHTEVLEAYIEEKLNTYDQLFMVIPADKNSEESKYIKEDQSIVFKEPKGWREYVINVVEDVNTGFPTKYIEADLSSIELKDEIIETDLSGASASAKSILESMLEGTRWEVGTVDSSIYTQRFSENTEYVSVLEGLDLLSSNYDCEVQFSYEVSANKITSRKVNLYKKFGRDEGKRFEMGKDVSEIKRTIETTDIKTAIIPMGAEPNEVTEYDDDNEEETTYTPERLDIRGVEWSVENGDPVDKPLGQNWLGNPTALENFGRIDEHGNRKHRKFFQEINVETEEALISMAWVQLGRYVNPKVTYETKIYDIYILSGYDADFKHEHVFLGDVVVVLDRNFKNPIEVETRVVEMKRDLLNPVMNEVTLGESRTLFSNSETLDRINELEDRVNKDIKEVHSAITSVQDMAGGGSIYRGSVNPVGMNINDIWFRPNPTKPQYTQMLIWNGTKWDLLGDDADLEDASRLNFGILDGALLNVINLNADSITGGSLDLAKGISIKAGNVEVLSVDTETGEVEINATSFRVRTMSLDEYLKKQMKDDIGTYSVEVNGSQFFRSDTQVNIYSANIINLNGEVITHIPDKEISYRWYFIDPNNREKLGEWERIGRSISITRDDFPQERDRDAGMELVCEVTVY